ncbi:ras-related C3 botulinum toxin substrate 1-like [Antedon mediterranea]|uniref:ras-related C3 botulinum toxin substrate 1-like n=1 Tax=Antedon mediterranea TaxID=105859 RepID=UPI003AF47AAE
MEKISRVSKNLEPFYIKSVTIGDSSVGKTCLLTRVCKHKYPDDSDFVPTEFGGYGLSITVDGVAVEVNPVEDTIEEHGSMREDFCNKIRSCYYCQANVFIICFDLSNPTSYENVSKHWYPEIQKHCRNVPFVLVGTKLDLREDEDGNPRTTDGGTKFITYEQGQEMKSKVGALDYFECSALTEKGVNDMIQEAVCHGISHKLKEKKKKKNCVVL